MRTFKDRDGREWEIVIDLPAVKLVKQLAGVDILAGGDDKAPLFGGMLDEPVKLVDCLYVLCRRQAEARKLTDEDFGRAFSGEAIEAATDALTQELIDFFPPRRREAVRDFLLKAKRISERRLDRGAELLRQIDPEAVDLDKLIPIQPLIDAGLISTPKPGPGASSGSSA